MERIAPFVLARPASLAEAVALLAATPGARPLAGGTDMLPNLRDAAGNPVEGLSTRHAQAAGIPGEPAGWQHLATHYGRLPLATSLALLSGLAQALTIQPYSPQALASAQAAGYRLVLTLPPRPSSRVGVTAR